MHAVQSIKRILAVDLGALLSEWWKNESTAAKCACLSAAIVGFVSHLFIYANRYFGDHDLAMISVLGEYHGDYMHGHGRWLSAIMTHASYYYVLPLFSGIMVAVFSAVAAFAACKTLGMENKLNAAVAGALMATFPSISNINLFLYDSASYHFAVALAAVAVWITLKWRRGFIVAALLLMCSLAIYQAMFNVACALCLFVLIIKAISSDFEWKAFGKTALRFLLMGILAGVLYALSLFLNARLFGNALGGYVDISADNLAGRVLSMGGILSGLKNSYQTYVHILFGGREYMLATQLRLAYILAAALSALMLGAIIVTHKIYRSPPRLIITLLLLLLIPVASNFAAFIDGSHAGLRMAYAFVFVFVFFLALTEQALTEWPSTERPRQTYSLLKSALFCTVIVIGLNWIIVNNVYYLQAWFFNRMTNSVTTRIAARVEPLLAQVSMGQISVFGGIPNEYLTEISNEFTENPQWRSSPLNSTVGGSYFIHMKSGDSWMQELLSENLINLHGVNVGVLQDEALRENIREHILAENMPLWPLEGSVTAIEDVIVINFGIADVVGESEGEAFVFRARHYVGEDLAAQAHEYHWQLFRNGVPVYDAVSAADALYIEPFKAYGAYVAWVTVQNKQTGYAYPRARSERVLLGVPAGGTAADILPAYLAQIKDDNHVIIISAKDEASTAFTENMAAAFRALGLAESLVDKYRHSYVAIIDGDEVLFEDISQEQISHGETVGNTQIEVKSAGFDAGDMSSILIDAVEYSPNMRGLNIVVYDKAAGVVDAVNFDTYAVP